jgi:hypothetical protein
MTIMTIMTSESLMNLIVNGVPVGHVDSLRALCKALNEHRKALIEARADMSHLPTFGGETPLCTEGVWSWDDECKLVQDKEGRFVVVPQDDW